MPMADEMGDAWGKLTRTLAYGRDKSKKTWWAARAAEAGFNVILVDGDDGASIIRNLPVEAKKRILVADVVDTNHAAFAMFMATFLKLGGNEFLWDEQDKCSVPLVTKLNPNHSYIYFNASLLTSNDVFICDSWTALADSTKQKFAKDTGYDLIEVERSGDQFALPNFQARFLDFVLSRLHTLPCHVIVIGHEQTWDKSKGTGKDRKIIATLTQPYSSTGPHAQKLGKHFENVLHFYKLSDTAYRISTVGDDTVSAGSRLLAPDRYKWEDITPGMMLKNAGFVATNEPCHGAIYIPKGGSVPVLAKSNTTNTQVAKLAAQTPVANSAPAAQVLDGGSMTLAQKLMLRKA